MAVVTLGEIKKILLKTGRFHIVFIGDSITSEEWVHPNWREIIEYVLKDRFIDLELTDDWRVPEWGIRGINSGYDGASTSEILARLDEAVFKFKPEMAISLFGGADVEVSDKLLADEKKLMNEVSSKVPVFVYCTSLPCNNEKLIKNCEKYVVTVKSILPAKGVHLIDMFSLYRKYDLAKMFDMTNRYGNKVLKIQPGEVDFVHPSQLGNAYIAQVLLKEVFGVDFDPEQYLREVLSGMMWPRYQDES